MKRWMLRPVARCKNGCIGGRVAPAPISSSQRTLKTKLKGILCLNLLDAIFTLCWVSFGLAEESNPLMEYLLSRSPIAFMLGKIVLVSLGVALLWTNRTVPFANTVTSGLLFVYSAILMFHLFACSAILFS